ncbi:MAG: glycine cleavage system H protein [Ardenticatenaceae bacterium]|nr:MAG: glycine cleavage system H protein [Ardenticatenaceae bacterium]
MSNIPADLKYTEDDEWVMVEDGIATIGITDHAQDALSDIVYLELPNEGDFFGVGETFGVVESVKAAADLLMAVSGDVTAVNDDLVDTPELLNQDPYGAAWLVKLKMSAPDELDNLMDAAAYEKYLSERE